MVEIVTQVAGYRHEKAWEGRDIAEIGGARAMLLFADEPYHWHENRADELFCVVAGTVDMDVRDADGQRRVTLEPGDMAVIRKGESHVAHPRGEARILIVAGD